MSPTSIRALVVLGAALAVGCSFTLPQPDEDVRAERLYETCAPCHGDDGAGNQQFGAPAIAGQPLWYIRRQLDKFREGHRGADPQDYDGLRMRAMVRTLNHEGDLDAISEHVAAMPAVPPAPVLEGDVENGRTLYRSCVQCHGGEAAGNIERDAPPLTGLNDWYIVAQLQLFKAGDRGSTAGDETGATMRPMAIGLADEQAMTDVAVYIATLRGQ